MSGCRRFEDEGLLVLQQGGALDPHFGSCPDCLGARAAYEGLERRLGALHPEAPPAGWQSGVWAAIEDETRQRPSRVWLTAAAAAILLALGLAVFLRRPVAPVRLLASAVESSPGSYRGGDAARPGDVLVLKAQLPGTGVAELRLYQDDTRLVAACSTEAPCAREGSVLTARFPLPSVGSYQPALVLSTGPAPAPTGRLDADAGAAHASGARFELGEPVVVR